MHQEPYGDERYSRQTLFRPLGPEGQERIRRAKVLVVGCGALGTHSAEYLVRAGVGELHLVDRDVVDWSNLGRQIGFNEEDARDGLPKASALARHLARVNSGVRIVPKDLEFHFANALLLAGGMDLLLDGSDNVSTRFLLNDVSFRLGIPWIYAGAVEATGHAMVFSGLRGPCLSCLLGSPPPPGSLATCDTAGVLGPAVGVVASWQATLALRILVQGHTKGVEAKHVRLHPWEFDAHVADVRPDPACPVCVEGRHEFLAGGRGEDATELCGRNAVHVRPACAEARVDLEALGDRLSQLGPAVRQPHFLRWSRGPVMVTVFPDGRAIFDGLTDRDKARSLYARYIGE